MHWNKKYEEWDVETAFNHFRCVYVRRDQQTKEREEMTLHEMQDPIIGIMFFVTGYFLGRIHGLTIYYCGCCEKRMRRNVKK